jgi:hypothetical protein
LGDAGFEKASLYDKYFFRLAEFWLKKNGSKVPSVNLEVISVAPQSAFHGNILLRIFRLLSNKMLAATGTGSSLVAVYTKPTSKA